MKGESYALIPYKNEQTLQPTSLLGSILRNPSELHLEYLVNMGAASSFSLSIIVDGRLWGIVACHNFQEKSIGFERREIAQLLTKFFNAQLKEEKKGIDEQLSSIFESAREGILRQMATSYDIWEGLTKGEYTLIDLNNADGAAMIWENQLFMEGKTPQEEDIFHLFEWFSAEHPQKDIFYTDHLSHHYKKAKDFTRFGSGALFLKIANAENYIVWFKKEVIRETHWAGNPNNPEKKIVDMPFLHPRKSFDRWIELSRGYSEPWEYTEIQTINRFQKDITSFIISANRKLRELNFKLQVTLEERQQLVEELHAAEEELRQTHDFQQEIIEQLSKSKSGELEESKEKRRRIGSLIIDTKYRITSFNEVIQDFFDQSINIADNIIDKYPPEEEKEFYLFCERALNGEKSIREVKRTVKGRLRWLKEYFYPIYNAKENVYAIGCDIQDITQRKQAEDVVHNLALIARNAQNAIMITDKNQYILWVNPSFTKLTGYTIEEVLEKNPNKLLAGEETDFEVIKNINRQVSNYESCEVELINYHKSGRKYWAHIYLQPYIDTFGEQRFFSIHTDITNQKLTNLAIAESEEKFRLLSENAYDLVALQDKNGNFTYVSPSVERLLGYSQEELIGKNPIPLIHSSFRPTLKKYNFYEFIKTSLHNRFEYLLKKFSGEYIWVETSYQIIKKEGQETAYIQSITRNIDARKKAELALEKTNDDLNKVNQELDSFVYSVSHDLRSPIASSLGLIEVMQGEKDIKVLGEYMELQKQSLNRLDSFISDIVNYSRNSRLEIAADKIDFYDLVESIFSNYSFLPDTNHIKKEIFIKGNSEAFYSDSLRLKIILSNLISNALNYHNSYAKEDSYLHVSIDIKAEKAIITVEDNGVGIDKKYQSRIFEMFFRANNLKPGSGIGLYIVKETVAKIKGSISFVSKSGKGTSFTLEVPNLKALKEAKS